MTEVPVAHRPPRKTSKIGGRNLDRLEQDLLTAKNAKRKVFFDLAVATRYTDTEGTVEGFVCQVDKYAIEIELAGRNTRYWISKAMIVGYEIG